MNSLKEAYEKSTKLKKGSFLFDRDYFIAEECKNSNLILDVGIGQGRIAKLILQSEALKSFEHSSKQFKIIKGIDIAETAIKINKKEGIEVKQCDLNLQKIPYKSSTFDTAICTEVIEHLTDPLKVLSEINRVLQKEGKLIISTPNIGFLPNRVFLMAGHFTDFADTNFPQMHLRFFTFNVLSKYLSLAGFKVTKRIPVIKVMEKWPFPINKTAKALAKLFPNLFSFGHLVICKKASLPKQKEIKSTGYAKEYVEGKKPIIEGLKKIWNQT